MDDQQIIALYFRRSEQAIVQTDAKYGAYCMTIAERILSNREDSEEAVNDTYLAAWEAIPPQKPPMLSTFLGKITRNLSIDRWRSRMAGKRGGGEFEICLEELADCVSGKTETEAEVMMREMTVALNRFLRSRPAAERKVFLCRYWQMKTVPEISGMFGFSQTKVTTMLYRTRIRLRKQLEKEGLL